MIIINYSFIFINYLYSSFGLEPLSEILSIFCLLSNLPFHCHFVQDCPNYQLSLLSGGQVYGPGGEHGDEGEDGGYGGGHSGSAGHLSMLKTN